MNCFKMFLFAAFALLVIACEVELYHTEYPTYEPFVDDTFAKYGLFEYSDESGITADCYALAVDSAENVFIAVTSAGARIVKLTKRGKKDKTFGTDGVLDLTSGGYIRDLLVDSSDRIIACGMENDNTSFWRLNNDGTPDITFFGTGKCEIDINPGSGWEGAYSLAMDSTGKIVFAGLIRTSNEDIVVGRLKGDGTPDTGFNGTGYAVYDYAGSPVGDTPYQVVTDLTDNVFVCGRSDGALILKYTSNGNLDTGFASGGVFRDNSALHGSWISSLAFDSSGRLVATGAGYPPGGSVLTVRRLFPDGALDINFGNNGLFTYSNPQADYVGDSGEWVGILADGTILVGGIGYDTSEHILILALQEGGSLHPGFNSGNPVYVYLDGNQVWRIHDIVKYPDNRLLISGLMIKGALVPMSPFVTRMDLGF